MPASLSGVNLVDPQTCLIDFTYRGLPTETWAGKVNSFSSPVERGYGVGRVLVRKSDVGLLKDTNNLTLKFIDTDGTEVSFPRLSLIKTENILPGDLNASGSILMLTLADIRYRYSQKYIGRSYNYRDINTGEFLEDSLNGNILWTWHTILSDIWAKMVSGLGDAGPMPMMEGYGSVEGFSFTDDNGWDAFCQVVQAGGKLVRFDPVTTTVSIVDPSLPEPEMDFDTLGVRVWDTDDAIEFEGPLPGSVTVTFPRPGMSQRHREVYVGAGGMTDTTAIINSDMPAVGDPVMNTVPLGFRADNLGRQWVIDWKAARDERQIEFRGYIDWCRTAVGYGGFSRWSVYDLGDSAERRGPLSTSIERGPVLVQSMGSCCGSLNGSGSGGFPSGSGSGESGSGTGSGSGSGSDSGSGSGSGGSGSGGSGYTFEVIEEICPIYEDDDCCTNSSGTGDSGSGSGGGSGSGSGGTDNDLTSPNSQICLVYSSLVG